MRLDWKAKYRIKAALSGGSLIATFALLAFLQLGVGIFFVPLSILPGTLLSIFLWPEVLAPEPLPQSRKMESRAAIGSASAERATMSKWSTMGLNMATCS